MNAKHTPGPWRFVQNEGEVAQVRTEAIRLSEGDLIAVPESRDLRNLFDGYLEQEANARLIAAAPELLEALESYVAAGQQGHPPSLAEYESACAAIAKARGES